MYDFNQMSISGRLGRDPELRHTAKGLSVLGFSVANNAKKDGDTLWFKCTVFGKQAESISKLLHKGQQVVVTGRLETDEWKGKTSLAIIAESVHLMGSKGESAPPARAPAPAPVEDEDIPF